MRAKRESQVLYSVESRENIGFIPISSFIFLHSVKQISSLDTDKLLNLKFPLFWDLQTKKKRESTRGENIQTILGSLN